MAETDLEQALRQLPQIGTLVEDCAGLQVWRFEFDGRAYWLRFHFAQGWQQWLSRRLRGSPALREFLHLQWLQKAHVPSPRAVAVLLGFGIRGRKGDAVVLEAIEPAMPLDQYLSQLRLNAQAIPNHRQLVGQMIELLSKLAKAGLGHTDLHLGSFLIGDGKLFLSQAAGVHRKGLRLGDIQPLALSALLHATRTDLLRAWKQLGPGGALPAYNRRGKQVWRKLMERAFGNDRYFGRLAIGEYRGHFFKHTRLPQRWATASHMEISEQQWQEAWPLLLKKVAGDQFEILKSGSSGDVLAGEVVLGGRPLEVIVKRPRRKYWYRYLNEIGRGSRARRAWAKAWQLAVRNIPTAWPLAMMEKRVWGYTTDAIMVCQRIGGQTLSKINWQQLAGPQRRQLLLRCGRLLRQVEQSGLYLYDAKADNWMVAEDAKLGLFPMLIDVDSIRPLNQGGGLPRLLRSLRESRRGFTDEDALALAGGYAPFANRQRLAKLTGLPLEAVPGLRQPNAAEVGR